MDLRRSWEGNSRPSPPDAEDKQNGKRSRFFEKRRTDPGNTESDPKPRSSTVQIPEPEASEQNSGFGIVRLILALLSPAGIACFRGLFEKAKEVKGNHPRGYRVVSGYGYSFCCTDFRCFCISRSSFRELMQSLLYMFRLWYFSVFSLIFRFAMISLVVTLAT